MTRTRSTLPKPSDQAAVGFNRYSVGALVFAGIIIGLIAVDLYVLYSNRSLTQSGGWGFEVGRRRRVSRLFHRPFYPGRTAASSLSRHSFVVRLTVGISGPGVRVQTRSVGGTAVA